MAYEEISIQNYLWKLGNKSESVWYLNCDYPLSLPVQLSEVEITLQTGVKNTGLFLPLEPRGRAFFLVRVSCHYFSSCLKCLVAEIRSQENTIEKKEFLSCAQPPMKKVGSTKTWVTFSLAHEVLVLHQERQADRPPPPPQQSSALPS